MRNPASPSGQTVGSDCAAGDNIPPRKNSKFIINKQPQSLSYSLARSLALSGGRVRDAASPQEQEEKPQGGSSSERHVEVFLGFFFFFFGSRFEGIHSPAFTHTDPFCSTSEIKMTRNEVL